MNKKARGFSLFLVSLLLLCPAVSFVGANFKPAPLPPLVISNNGEVSPSSDLIVRNGDVYTFTGNLTTMFLQVERSNIVIRGEGFFIVGNTVGLGISLNGVQNVSVLDLGITKTNLNIYLDDCSKVKIDSCSTVGGSFGIYLNESKSNIITGNKLSSFYGIFLDHSANNVLKHNSIQPSSSYAMNFMVTGESLADYINDVDSSNLINGKSIIYWVGRQNAEAPANSSYVVG